MVFVFTKKHLKILEKKARWGEFCNMQVQQVFRLFPKGVALNIKTLRIIDNIGVDFGSVFCAMTTVETGNGSNSGECFDGFRCKRPRCPEFLDLTRKQQNKLIKQLIEVVS